MMNDSDSSDRGQRAHVTCLSVALRACPSHRDLYWRRVPLPLFVLVGGVAYCTICGFAYSTQPFSGKKAREMIMKAPIFVYGTLCSPQVVEILLGRSLGGILMPKARLQGYARYPVRNYVFPGTIPTPEQPNSIVDGFLLENLTDRERKLLDFFEGDEYDREIVQVLLGDSQKEDATVPAQVYIWKAHLIKELELDRMWSYESFLKDHLEWYLENTVRPCRKEMELLGMTKEEE